MYRPQAAARLGACIRGMTNQCWVQAKHAGGHSTLLHAYVTWGPTSNPVICQKGTCVQTPANVLRKSSSARGFTRLARKSYPGAANSERSATQGWTAMFRRCEAPRQQAGLDRWSSASPRPSCEEDAA